MGNETNYTPEFIEWAKQVETSKRAQRALEFLIEQGSVTTGDLRSIGYDHPPRAIRDLKDSGFAIDGKMVNIGGRRMSQYTLIDSISSDFAQRKPIPNAFRKKLFEAHSYRCAVCGGAFISRMLQADHRVPFHVGGDPEIPIVEDFMPLCGSDNRAKSMSCENCSNWESRDSTTCQTCYWHDPENYAHVATVEERRLTITARDGDVATIDGLKLEAETEGLALGELVLRRLADL